jgi:hypothetical protein
MIEFFKKQSTFVKVLIIAVVVVVIGFIVQQIYKRFIKNAILREMYEDIKIVIESKCPDGYAYDKDLSGDKCTICQVPNVVPNSGEAPCSQSCLIDNGEVVNFVSITSGKDAGKKAGKGCVLCSNGQTPDPNPTIGTANGQNDRTSCVNLIQTTEIVPGLTFNSLNLVGTSAVKYSNGSDIKLYALSCRLGNAKAPIVSVTTPSPSSDGSIVGQKTFLFTVNGINVLNNIPTNQQAFNITTNYGSNSNAKVWSYLNFLFTQNQNTVKSYLVNLINASNPDIVVNANMLGINNIKFLNNDETISSTFNPSTTPSWKPSFVQVVIDWNCGTPSTTSSQCYTSNNKSVQDDTYTYTFRTGNSSALTPNEFGQLYCFARTSTVNCKAGQQNCILKRNTNDVMVDKNLISYNPSDTSYTFTNKWTFPIQQLGISPGTLCDNPTNFVVYDPATNQPVTDTNVKYLTTPSANEISIVTGAMLATVTRSCKIKYGETIFVALPSGYANITLPTYATPTTDYANPTDYADRFNGKYLLYKKPSSSLILTGASCEAANNSLEVLSISQSPNATFDQYNNSVRTTMINAKRNVYETISVDPKDSGKSFYIYNKLKFILGQISSLFSSDSVINQIYLASNTLNTSDSTKYTTTVNANSSLSPIPSLTNITSFNTWPISSGTFSGSELKNTIISMSSNGSKIAACINKDKLYDITTANVSPGNSVGTANTTFVSTPTAPIQYSWISINNNSGVFRTAVAYNGSIYTSYNSGNNWYAQSRYQFTQSDFNTQNFIPTVDTWSQVCMSDDGTIQYAISSPGFIYYSLNGGYDWVKMSNSFVTATGNVTITPPSGTPNETLYNWSGIDCSSDGTQFSVCMKGGQIYYGRMAKSTTTTTTAIPNTNVSVTGPSSAVITMTKAGNVTDGGNPLSISPNWKQISLSRSGKYQTAIINGYLLARSDDNGLTWSFPTEANTNGWSINTGKGSGYVIKNWVDVKIAPNTGTDEGKYQVAIESSKTSIGEDPDTIGVYWSNDYGKKWNPITSKTFSKILCNVQIDTGRNIYISSNDGTITQIGSPIPA